RERERPEDCGRSRSRLAKNLRSLTVLARQESPVAHAPGSPLELVHIMSTTPPESRDTSFQQVHDEVLPEEHHPVSTEHLVQQFRETADKLLRDGATRGDVKLLNTALKELRYCFKVFARYRGRKKVTVFGSARLPETHPAFAQAVEFGRQMAALD